MVLHGRCDEDAAIPFRPIREFLTHYVASVPYGRLAGHDPHRLGELTRLVPELAQRLPQLPDPTRTDPQAERYVLFAAVAGLLSEIASEMPVILVLDDLHWADRPTLLLLRHLAGAALGQVLVLGTYRDVEAVAGQSLAEAVAALCREPTVGHIRLQGLVESAVAAVMAAMAGGALDAEGRRLARDLAHETDGNAFMVVEHVRHLWRTGVLTRAEDGTATTTSDLASAGLPHTVQQVVAGHLAPLGDAADRVVSVASVIGEQFDLDLLVAATGWDHDRVLEVLEAAGHQALVTEAAGPAGRFRFAHATVRHVIYQRLGPTRQAWLHARIGQALEDLCGDEPGERAGELARHFHAGRPAHARKAARYARLAGERALAALAPHEAAGWFSQAIEALQPVSDDAERVRCMVGLGDAQIQAGIPTGRHTLLDAARTARQLGESDLLICAALASNRGMFARTGHVDAELVALLEDALEVCPGSPQRAWLLSRLAAELTFHPDPARRRAIADEAVAAAQASGDAAALLDALTRPDTALMIPERCEPLSASQRPNSPGAACSSRTIPTAPGDSSPTPPPSPPTTGTATYSVQYTTRRPWSSSP